ncbi:MAG: hypothetical protein V3V31_09525 [Methylococcales bacterium]
MIGKSGQNGFSHSRFSILGQSPRCRSAGRVISFKVLQRRSSRKYAR